MARFCRNTAVDLPQFARFRGLRVDPSALCADCQRQFLSPQRRIAPHRARLPRHLIRAAVITVAALLFVILMMARV